MSESNWDTISGNELYRRYYQEDQQVWTHRERSKQIKRRLKSARIPFASKLYFARNLRLDPMWLFSTDNYLIDWLVKNETDSEHFNHLAGTLTLLPKHVPFLLKRTDVDINTFCSLLTSRGKLAKKAQALLLENYPAEFLIKNTGVLISKRDLFTVDIALIRRLKEVNEMTTVPDSWFIEAFS